MKQTLIIFTLLISVLWSCKTKTETKTKTTSSEKEEIQTISIGKFENYVSTLEQIPLPLNHNPLGQLPELSKTYNQSGFKKFKHTWTSKPLGILYQDKQTVGIIDCCIGDWGLVPLLTTYDVNGNKIDSINFYKKSGQDLGYEAMEYLTFTKNRTILVIDTVKRWKINEEEADIVEGSLQWTTGVTQYQILENGKIKMSSTASR